MNFGLRNFLTVSIGVAGLMALSATQAQEAKPTWELGKNPFDPATTKGKVELVDGVVKLDGTNSFVIPVLALGSQSEYTIEFEVKKDAGAKGGISLVSNTDEKNKTGLGFKYFAPEYNAIWLFNNGYQAVEYRNFLDDKFNKVTIVAKDKRLTLFKNGLILATTGEVRPSTLPLSFGEILKEPCVPYELRNVKIYDTALFPTGFDQSAERMRYYSGDQYFMQRVEIKDPSLPRILITGDSISMGYRGTVSEYFKGKANIDYWTQGYWNNMVDGENSPLERALSGVLSNGPYDVITFNFGLHSWSRPDRSPEDKYVAQMTKTVDHLRKIAPNTKFIWIRTTPCTIPVEGKPSVINMEKTERLIKFNKMTDELMAKYGIPEVDLYALCEKNLDKASKDGVHWNGDAYRLMGEEIIKAIEKILPEKHKQDVGK